MKIGFAAPQYGPLGTRENILKVVKKAEELAYDSLWVLDRLLYPVKPRTPYPATPDGSLPEEYKHVLDPIDVLTFVAASSKKLGVGTSVLDIPYYNPVVLARQLTTLDILSGGRLRAGFGVAWSEDECEATGAPYKGRGNYSSEFLQVLKAIWTTDPVEFKGKYFTLAKSHIGPKPIQKPHPPIVMAAYVPAALKRIAKYADGWNPVGVPADGMKQMFAGLKQMAQAEGRDPNAMKLYVRANLMITDKPAGKDRWIFSGNWEEIKQDVEACKQLQADEIFFDPFFSPDGHSIDKVLSLMERLRKLV
jgi:probable F420-dependent oxidoreductase